ncbi:MAG: pitrilysin family protein [Candidatus Gastranaerophilales bacterium]|nr:pitrilysin family protein [Candidatus Gastranaerophilales bacterium]
MIKKIYVAFVLTVTFFAVNTVCFAQDLSVFKLQNGHTVVVKEVHANPIVTIDTWVKTGSINENDENNGVSHFLEHLFFKGTTNHKQGEFEKILESKGGVFNAATSKDFTHFYITIASNYFEEAVDLHSDMLLNITIPEDELARERKVVIEEIGRAKGEPNRNLFKNMNDALFKTHPYHYEVLGTEEIVANIPREKILEYYNKWYTPSNMVTVIVGDVDTQKALSLVSQKFQDKTPCKACNNKIIKEPYLQKPVIKIQKGDYNGGYLLIAFKGVDIKNQKDNYSLDIAASILGDGVASRLYQSIKEKNNLALSIDSGHSSQKDDSIFYIIAKFEPQNYEKLKTAIIDEIEKFKANPITKNEIDRAKTMFERNFIYSNESTSDIAGSIAYSLAIGNDIKYYTEYIDDLNKITEKDIKNALNKYIDTSKMVVSVLLPEDSNIKNTSDIQKTDCNCNSQPTLETYGNTVSTTLSNGIKLIFDKNTSNDIVAARIFIRGGNFLEEKPGISSLLASTIMKGTKNRSFLEMSTEIQDNGIVIGPSADDDYFEIDLKSTKKDFDKAFDILADVLQNAVFEEKYIDKTRKDMLLSIKQSRDNPSSIMFEEYTSVIYSNHPYGVTGKTLEKTLSTITREDVIDYYNSYFSPQNMVVSVSGNAEINDLIKKFESIKTKSQAKIVDISQLKTQYAPFTANKRAFKAKDTSTAWMALGWRTQGVLSEKDYASLKVISGMLGGGMSSRLFSNLREKRGLAYEVGSIYPSKMDLSSFMVYIGTNPKNVPIMEDLFLKEINEIKTGNFTQKELADVKQKIIGKFELSKETSSAKAHYLGWFETIGKGYKFNYFYSDLINSVTYQDVINTADKYLCYPHVTVLIAPKEEINELNKDSK